MSRRYVAVFGSSAVTPGSDDYEEARSLGRGIATRGFAVLTGGYAGVMEAASRGARDAGGYAAGVTCTALSGRRPNEYLNESRSTDDLYARSRELIDPSSAFVVLHGCAGTLCEISLLWALERAGCLGSRPVIVLGDRWPSLLEALVKGSWIEMSQARVTRFANDPEEALDMIVENLGTA